MEKQSIKIFPLSYICSNLVFTSVCVCLVFTYKLLYILIYIYMILTLVLYFVLNATFILCQLFGGFTAAST